MYMVHIDFIQSCTCESVGTDKGFGMTLMLLISVLTAMDDTRYIVLFINLEF